MELTIIHNETFRRFETAVDGELAYAEYKLYSGRMVFTHTFTPESMRGKGVSSALAKFALDYAVGHRIAIIVLCPFITAYLEKHPEYNEKLDIAYSL